MTPLEERLQQALSARAELITHETVSPARPPGPDRTRRGRVAVTATVLAAAATAAIVATVTFTSLGRPGSSDGPAGRGEPTIALGTTATRPTTSADDPAGTATSLPEGTASQDPARSTNTTGRYASSVQMRPEKLSAGSIASFRGSCPNPGGTGTVGSEAFLANAEHQVGRLGAQSFTIGKDGTFAGSVAVEPSVTPANYQVFLWCGSTDAKPDDSRNLTVLEAQPSGTDQDIRLAAHKVYPGEWVAFSGVCVGGTPPTSGWVISPAFEPGDGREFAGVAAVPFTSDDNGLFVGTAHIPGDQTPGRYKVTVRCSGGILSKTETLEILAR